MKEKEKTKVKKVKKATASVKKKKTKAKTSASVKKKRPPVAVKSTKSKKAIQVENYIPDISQEVVKDEGATGSPVTSFSEDAGGLFLSCSVTGEFDDVSINEDGTVSYHKREEGDPSSRELEYLVFRVSDRGFAIRLLDVQEIVKQKSITKVPRSGEHVIGVTSLRGSIVPVVNLGSMLALSMVSVPDKGWILLLKQHGLLLGLLVSGGLGIKRFNPVDMKPPLPGMGTERSVFVAGVFDVGGEFITVLETDAITRTRATGRLDETEA